MQKVTIQTPAVYGDHHVTEVRRLLYSLNGVSDVYASSCFHIVEVEYNPDALSEEMIRENLQEAGYLADLSASIESGPQIHKRNATSYEHLNTAISFAQAVAPQKEARHPCPGLGILKVPGDDHA